MPVSRLEKYPAPEAVTCWARSRKRRRFREMRDRHKLSLEVDGLRDSEMRHRITIASLSQDHSKR